MLNDAVGSENIWILLPGAIAGSYKLYALLLLSLLKIKTGGNMPKFFWTANLEITLLDYCIIPTTAIFE